MVPQPISAARADDRLSLTFNALADPTRRAILQRLLKGQASVGELAEPFDMSTRAISKHIAVLEAAGLVTRARELSAGRAESERSRWLRSMSG